MEWVRVVCWQNCSEPAGPYDNTRDAPFADGGFGEWMDEYTHTYIGNELCMLCKITQWEALAITR